MTPKGEQMNVRSIVTTGMSWSVAVGLSAGLVFAQGGAAKPASTTPAAQQPTAQKPPPPPPPKPDGTKPAATSAALRTPSKLKEVAPATFQASFDTSVGTFVIEVTRAWAPRGADRFYNLVKHGYYDNGRFFRVMPKFMVQFGINGDSKIQSAWRDATIPDDPVIKNNTRGFVTFAKTSAPNSRSTQIFINYGDNSRLDADGFAPFGQVVSGMEVVDKINAEHRQEPDQARIQAEGNAYLMKAYPRLDYVNKATIVK
jgi:peptidyl-prolyl cis-trans isomerase A (cyclophilin A)